MKLTLKGNPVELLASPLEVGAVCPDFKAKDVNFSDVNLYSLVDKKVLLLTVPSLDTPICNDEACAFNKLIVDQRIPADIRVVLISKDLPFAQKRWLQQSAAGRLTLLSDFPHGEAGKALGVETSLGLLARACFLAERSGEKLLIKYQQIVQEIASEPNYEEILAQINR